MRKVPMWLLSAALLAASFPLTAGAAERFITVASTTSTKNSGLFDHIVPLFEKKTGIQVRVVAVGTGQAIRLARNGDTDVLFVHHRPSEEKFVADGFGVQRFGVMYNDFVIAGPKDDPARIAGMRDAAKALKKIAGARAPFVSRGDDSGTHKKELALWRAAGVDTARASGTWYRETGSGMGATLNTASAMQGYALADRGTWLSFKNRAGLRVLVEGDTRLFNPYGVILVNPKRHPHVKADLGREFIAWLISPEGQAAIGTFRINGEVLFKPNAMAVTH
ncbi:MAG: substrate-binding domain-containing protein [Alphaproteobacteria bacterium]|nr:substrate-binding domain-containing protein [Alphaproteobacteria bacterium]